jgi:diguanylate cyclase (GGDEF)-like protein
VNISAPSPPKRHAMLMVPAVAPHVAPLGVRLEGPRGVLLVIGSFLLIVLIALVDCVTGPDLSFTFFYLIPVIACAWWGGFAQGILLALAALVAWHLVDSLENPLLAPSILLWNGVVRFGTFVLTTSLVSRLHAGILCEQRLARTDPLTGAANGRTFYQAAATEVERARRAERPLTLAYLDLDNFKQLNDEFGHATGDAALLHVVHSIRLSLRAADLLARLGGDEFALLLPETDAEGAASLLVRLQEILVLEMASKSWPVTLSIGAITFLRPSWGVDVMIQEVDSLMYTAKRNGKGRVEHAVVRDGDVPRAQEKRRLEKRATARVLCQRLARIRMQGEEDAGEEFATVSDLCDTGVGLYLDRRYPAETVLIVESLSAGAQVLLARVIHVSPDKRGWLHGCELTTRLGDGDLRGWVGESLEDVCT